MLYMIPFRFTKTKGAKFKAILDFSHGFQFRMVEARSHAECARKLREGLRRGDSRDIGCKAYIKAYTLEGARDVMMNSWATSVIERERRITTDEDRRRFEDSWNNLVATVRNRGVL